MSESEMEATKPPPGERLKKTLTLPRPVRWAREILALLVWGLIFTQLFIFDLGSYLTGEYPNLEPAFRYRFLILLSIVGALWLLLGNRRFLLFVGYIVAYPVVVAFWIFPRLLFRNWAVVIAFTPAIHEILTTFRTSFALFTIALVSGSIVSLASNTMSVIGGMIFLGFYLAYHYFRRFRMAFSPSTVFADLGGTIRGTWERTKDADFAKFPEDLDPDSEDYKLKFGSSVLSLYMMATGLYLLGERLREIVNSRKLDLYFLGSLMYTFLLTLIVFSLDYYGIERIEPGSFGGLDQPGLGNFLGYSFSTLMTSDISPLSPTTELARIATYFQLLCSFLIVVLLVFVLLTSIRERYKQDLDGVVSELRGASDRLGEILEANFELTLAAAELWLLEFNPLVTKWLLKLRHGEQGAKAITDSTDSSSD